MSAKKHYPEVESNPNFSEIENRILSFWDQHNLFQQSVDSRPKNNQYVFYDGPPFANGLPHYGHLLTGFVKDTVARYQTMCGKRVERRFGWDCHGLPAEMGAEKELQISGRVQITNFGVDKFNQYCRQSVLRYTNEWEDYVHRQARWVDFKNDYKTMDLPYMESVIWAFKQLYDKGLIYESMRVLPYSWACETPLSNFETRMDNSYRNRTDKTATVTFTLKSKPKSAPENCKAYKLLAWTTTPWTLPSNLALAVGKNITYACIIKDNECLIIAASLAHKYEKELGLSKEQQFDYTLPGEELVGLTYEPLFPYFANHKNAFQVFAADFVTEDDGTGIVHMAPGFGEDDYALCTEHNIDLVCPVDASGKFTQEVPEFTGQLVFDTVDDIIKMLKREGKWLKTDQYTHSYPHCWRTDTPLIYRALPSWYVAVTNFRDNMVKNNQQINWIPGHIRDGLFGKWLENAKDWSISRNRFWGTPIPVWKSDNPAYPRIDVYGSIAELERDFGVKITDLHKPFIDSLVRPNPDDPSGKSMMRRVPDVFDCWFESGSMPYAQVHYPFENKEWFDTHFPADFIVEYVAQTRGWFYTLVVLSTALFDKPPFLNCICHGVILDEHGHKLSKRHNNYADPREIFANYGADSLRFLMLSSAVMRGQELLIDKECRMVRDVLRLVIKPIWNSYNFFTLYANADEIKASFSTDSTNLMDRYILSKSKETVHKIHQAMNGYDTPSACYAIQEFFEILTNWYIRRNRGRFWKSEKDQDKQSAYNTLYTVLNTMCRASAPILPLITEAIYLGLENQDMSDPSKSVHLTNFPDTKLIPDNLELIADMDRIREICSAALSIRNDENIKTRLPLSNLTILGRNIIHLEKYTELIKDEVNVKNIQFSDQIGNQATLKLQLNFPVLGKRLPAKMKEIIAEMKSGRWQQDNNHLIIAHESLNHDEFEMTLEPTDTQNSRALPSNDALVVLDLNITKELKLEGTARDLVRIIQQARKEANLYVSDRITLGIEADEEFKEAINLFNEYISEQTLSTIAEGNDLDQNFAFIKETELDGQKLRIGFSVVE